MKAILLLLCLLVNSVGYSQECKIQEIKSYSDTLSVILDFESHLFCHPRSPLIKKLRSRYTDYEQLDTCFLFLVPDSQVEFESDGNYISHHIHKATLDNQKNVRWIEVTKLVQVKDFYLFHITTNNYTHGKKKVLREIHYKVYCKGKDNHYKFRKKLLAF